MAGSRKILAVKIHTLIRLVDALRVMVASRHVPLRSPSATRRLTILAAPSCQAATDGHASSLGRSFLLASSGSLLSFLDHPQAIDAANAREPPGCGEHSKFEWLRLPT